MSVSYSVAVIIPCWNCAQYIGGMLQCLFRQTLPDWKAFLIDDQSTDTTAEILQTAAVQDDRVHFVRRGRLPKGAQTCRNIGFELSQGAKYVIFFDADDLIAPYCLEQRVRFIDNHPDLDFGVFLSKSFVHNPNEIENATLFGFPYTGLDDLQRLLRRTHPFVIWSNIYRRSSLVRANIHWDERILSLQDSDFNLQTFHQHLRYDYDRNCRIDYFYRTWHNNECTSRKIASAEHKESHLLFLEKLYTFLSEEQKHRCRLELDDYWLWFIEKYYDDPSFVSRILDLSWVKHRLWFRIRIRLYCMLKCRNRSGKKYLFPRLNSYREGFDAEYVRYQHLLLTKTRLDIDLH